ncbi:MAG: hypothetical protein JWO56_2559 [Acidobacteria bacterium]|nr:hypothetical protein [Acidobacteriota bacterium]
MTSRSLRTLITALVDYAGLFPPAGLSMDEAVRNYARYREGEYTWALGRFVVPAARVGEVPRDFPLSVLVADVASMPDADTIEVKAASADDVERIARATGDRTVYVEIADVALLDAIAAHGLRAKIRTGGITADAFPDERRVARFIRECMMRPPTPGTAQRSTHPPSPVPPACLPFKATAGLHHPLRCVKPLTYEPDAPRGTMHGFVNVFLAAAMPEGAEEILLDDDPRSFAFDDDGVSWRGSRIATADLAAMRACAISFGSCSFEEPIDDLKELGWL